jgi:myo-inositol-1(or 4)-monophosphatase
MHTPSKNLLDRIDAAKSAVSAQIELLHREFGRAQSRWKSDGTRVTDTDVAISEGIFRDLRSRFPSDQYFSEEQADFKGPEAVTARHSWILDPIDGTNNFALGLPYCAIALALIEDGQPVYGVVYDHSRRVLMHGGPGFGMHDGERLATVASGTLHRESLVGFHSPFDKALVPLAEGILSEFKIRGLGSATLHLAYVAAGLLDGVVDYNLKIWDLAAAIPLCIAAGGEVRFLNGAQLPIRRFDLDMKRIIYVAGSRAMCDRLQALTAVRAQT